MYRLLLLRHQYRSTAVVYTSDTKIFTAVWKYTSERSKYFWSFLVACCEPHKKLVFDTYVVLCVGALSKYGALFKCAVLSLTAHMILLLYVHAVFVRRFAFLSCIRQRIQSHHTAPAAPAAAATERVGCKMTPAFMYRRIAFASQRTSTSSGGSIMCVYLCTQQKEKMISSPEPGRTSTKNIYLSGFILRCYILLYRYTNIIWYTHIYIHVPCTKYFVSDTVRTLSYV